jgi:hypothetical protein
MRQAEVYNAQEVFTPTSPARITFVPRDTTTNDRLVNALTTPGKQIVIYGRTGSGKTTLLINKLYELYESHIITNCIAGLTYDQLLLNAFDQLNGFYEAEIVKSKKKTVSPSVEIGSIGIKAKAGLDVTADRQTKHQRVLPPQMTPQTLARLLGEARCCWVIEDFHKIDPNEKRRLAHGIKLFVDMSDTYKDLKIIVIGAEETASQVIEYDSELRNRVSEIHIPLMTAEEIGQIIKRGETLLNVTITPEVKETITRYAAGSASTCHQLCLNLCFSAGINQTLQERRTLNEDLLNEAINMYIEETSATLKAAFDKALHRRRITKFYDAQLILEALLQFGLDGASKDEIYAKIKDAQPDYPRKNLNQHLIRIQKEQYGALIRFDSTEHLYSFADPFRRIYALSFFRKFALVSREPQLIEQIPAYEKNVEQLDELNELIKTPDQDARPDHILPSLDVAMGSQKVDLHPSVEKTWSHLIKYYFESPRGLSYYLQVLKQQIGQTPFLYGNLDLHLPDDYVPPEIRKIDLTTWKTIGHTDVKTNTTERLQQSKHIILIGTGTGTTTFMRNAVLAVINNKLHKRTSSFYFLYEKENPVPFYVPLKMIDNSAPYPILRYLLSSNPLLNQNSGMEILLNLARERRIFLALDGYDEIPFSRAMGKNYVQEELGWLMNGEQKYYGDDRLKAIYSFMEDCRLWISSRIQFFYQHNPFTASVGGTKPRNVSAIELCGLGNNRIELVKKIFNKYREGSRPSAHLLNEKYFLSEVDKAGLDWKNFSESPLFLTMMCYVYINKVVESSESSFTRAFDVGSLILECVSLLLADLDEYKVRNLTTADRPAILKRRNAYFEEKRQFMYFFAAQVLLEGKPYFDVDYITQKARNFFSQELNMPQCKLIIAGLNHDSAANPNIVQQLIYSGLFVLLDRHQNRFLYDFPNRLFKEVLAAKYLQQSQ